MKSGLQKSTDLGQIWGNYGDGIHLALDGRATGRFSFDANSADKGKHAVNGNLSSTFSEDSNSPSWLYDNYQIVSVEYEDGMLTIAGDKKTEIEDPDVKYVYKELKRSSFKRSFKVDDATLNVNKISAKFDNGILNVVIPKKEVIETKAKKVKIL